MYIYKGWLWLSCIWVVFGLWLECVVSCELVGVVICVFCELCDWFFVDLVVVIGVSIMGLSYLECGVCKLYKSIV